MNVCEFRHKVEYQVTYRPAKGSTNHSIWFVCDSCLKTKDYFGSEDEIVSLDILA